MGSALARAALCVFYFLVLAPPALVERLVGIAKRGRRERESYWKARTPEGADIEAARRQF